MRSTLYYTNTLSWILIVLADWNNSGYRHVAPLWHIILIPSKLVFALFALFLFSCVHRGEATNINFRVRVVQSLVLCAVLLLRSLIALLSTFLWPLCCLFIFDSRLLITSFGIFQLFLNNVHFCTVVGPDKLISKIDLLHLKKLNNTEMMTT